MKQVKKRQAGISSRRMWVKHSKKPGHKFWNYLPKLKYRFWLLVFRLGLFLLGAYYFNSAIVDSKGSGWGMERILMLAAGLGLLCISIFISIPKIINHFGIREKLEMFSRYLVQASVWCFLSLFIIELTLRVVIFNPPLRMYITNWAGDIPAVHTVVLWGKEGYGITQYEKWGEIRTPFYDNKKDNDVIVLGDSQTECLQVDDSLKFTSVAEINLRKDGVDADLHNLGRSGLAMADYISWIPPYRALYQPKVIVVQLTLDDFIESFHKNQFNYFIMQDNKNIELVHTFDFSSGFNEKMHVGYDLVPQIENLGYQRWYAMQDKIKNVPAESINSNKAENIQGENTSLEAFVPELAAQQMKMLIDVSEGTPLVLVLLPTAPNVSAGKIQMVDPAHEQLKKFIKGYPEVTVVDPLPEFQKLASTGRLPRGFFNGTPGSGHLNKHGNEIVGQLLAKSIEQVFK